MQKTLLIIIILCAIIGCSTNKKEEKTPDLTNEQPIINDDVKKKVVEEEIIVKTDNEIKDSIVSNTPPPPSATTNNEKQPSSEKATKVQSDVKEKAPVVVDKQKEEKIRADHSAWNLLAKKYVSSTGKVNYKGLKSEISAINSYLLHLEKVTPQKDWSKNEKLAYWFNLYNASTVQMVANAYPIQSIRDLNNGKPWDKKFVKSGNKTYSLNDIENTIVRPNYNEPRLHVAFNCAAVSCPKLSNEAFVSSKLNSQLTKLSKAWLKDPSKNKISENSIEISKIFDWYGADFKKGIIPFINKYNTIVVGDSAEIKYLEYNWDLND